MANNWPLYSDVGLNQHDVDYLIANKSTFFRCSKKSCLNAPLTGLTGLTELTSLTQAVPEPATVVLMLAGLLIVLMRFCLPAALSEYLGTQSGRIRSDILAGRD